MWPNSQETLDLVTFTEEIFNGKLFFVQDELKDNSTKCISIGNIWKNNSDKSFMFL